MFISIKVELTTPGRQRVETPDRPVDGKYLADLQKQ
jgi:hypothetical protein